MDALDKDYRPGFALPFGRLLDKTTRLWFRFELRNGERIPACPSLFVGNHSGIGIVDVLCLVGAWSARFGSTRRGVGMMHKMFVTAPIVGTIARAFGAVPADPELARQAFARGFDVATFPGGDLDSCRTFDRPRSVIFGPRRGYIRLALDQGVPIVPLAILGSHPTYTILPGGAFIARITGMKRWARTERFPLVLGTLLFVAALALAIAAVLPWWAAVIAFFGMLVPNPTRVTMDVLEPIDVCALTAHIDDPAARIEAAHELVHGAIARHVATMNHGERIATPTRRSIAE